MSFPNYKYGTGLNNVGSYQVSGKPFVSGGIDAIDGPAGGTAIAEKISFPTVSRWIYVVNNGSTALKVAFSENGLEGDASNDFDSAYFTVKAGTNSGLLELKLTEVYLTGSDDVDVLAGLTGVDIDRVNNISPSGSNWSGSVGIG